MKIGARVNPLRFINEDLTALAKWLAEIGYDAMDLMGSSAEDKAPADAAGLTPGSFDLNPCLQILTDDESKRAQALEEAKAGLDEAAGLGLRTAFVCCVPPAENRDKPRAHNFEIWKQVFPEIAAHAESKGLRLAMEPWPGPPPHFPTLGCTPEMWRAMFAACPSKALGLCYDPSHLARLGIDPIRALEEFGERVYHVHLKDVELLPEELYLYGNLPPSLDGAGYKFGQGYWRYTIPGDGVVPWRPIMVRLQKLGYDGVMSVEPEDGAYCESAELQRAGMVNALKYLKTVLP